MCVLDPNSYRGITLLISPNKVFEMIIWHRMEVWWEENSIISKLQGACKPDSSCVHSALVLQETIAAGLDANKVFVAYFDVTKAFDSVWIDGLFYQLHKKGVCGKIWRLLYTKYQNSRCRVRVNGEYSAWYPMTCGIHQGGFLSLLKYTAFIDPLITLLERSGTGCSVVGIPSSPVGYADDMATCSISKNKLDQALDIPYYPAYNMHIYTLQHLREGGGACYQRVHKPEYFYIDAMAWACGAWWKILWWVPIVYWPVTMTKL